MKTHNVLEDVDIPQVAMDAMNDVHREELAIVNQINTAILVNDVEKINLLCQQWLAHTKAHFEKENSMMEKYSFPAYHCHHGEHIEALQVLQSIIQDWNKKNDLEVLAAYVRDTWPQWYVTHISTMDMVTSAFIKQSMLNE
jgi:hemerythrin